MKTAARVLIIASMGVGCSGQTGDDSTSNGGIQGNSTSVVTSTPSTTSTAGTSANPTGTAQVTGKCVKGVPSTTQIPRMTMVQYDSAMRDLLNVTAVDGQTPSSALGLNDNKGSLTAPEWTAFQLVASKIAQAVVSGSNKAKFISCDATQPACLDATVKAFGKKAFRRPLTDDEVKAFDAFGSMPGTADQIATAVLNAFLVSPSFLMLPELAETKDANGNYVLTQYETATRLAALIWRSVPDDALLLAADNGELSSKEKILAQAQRMIAAKDKSGPLFADFHRYYAQIRKGDGHWARAGQDHDPKIFPKYTNKDVIMADMMNEVDAFFAEVSNTGSFKDLFLSPVAFVTKTTAPIYGLDAANYTDQLSRVELNANKRPGFLTRIGFLSSFSRYDSTSPILRGAFIGQNMLGAQPLAPQPGVPSEPPPGNYTTNREKIDKLTEQSGCASCHHVAINPPGYVMEAFSSIGEEQTIDPLGGAINSTADVQVDGNIVNIKSPLELMIAITNGTSGKAMYASRWVAYATQREPNDNDQCDANELALKLNNNNYSIATLLADLSQTDSFITRTVSN